MYVCDWV